jgi:hypothetical protein
LIGAAQYVLIVLGKVTRYLAILIAGWRQSGVGNETSFDCGSNIYADGNDDHGRSD